MKILLDECLPLDFRHHLPDHEVHTAEWAGFKSLKNGRLLQEAEGAGYSVFLTTDQGIPHQQNLLGRSIAVLVIRFANEPNRRPASNRRNDSNGVGEDPTRQIAFVS